MSNFIFFIFLAFIFSSPATVSWAENLSPDNSTVPVVLNETSEPEVQLNQEDATPAPALNMGIPAEEKTLAATETQSAVAPQAMTDIGNKVVNAVEVKGNKSIGLASILSKIKTRVGQDYLQSMISDDLKRLYNTGYFADVSVDREELDGGFKVIFIVKEKSIVDEITFSKLRNYNPRALERKLKTKKGKFLDTKILNDDVKMIEEIYAKKGLTQVKVTVETDTDDLTNKTKLHFVIKEGQRVQVKKIVVDGNQFFTDKRLIKVVKTRSAWMFNSGFLKEELLDEDVERLKSFYEKEGFIDAQAAYEIESINEANVRIHFAVQEGKRYYVDAITVEGNQVLSTAKILETMLEIKTGKVFSREKLSVDLTAIRALYFDKGYIFANVKESTSLNPETGKVDVKLDVTEGGLAYINKIKIQGNDRTKDVVIRRELRLYPGDQFDGVKLRRSKERLGNLGYFEDINYDIEDTDVPDKKDLVVQVKETKTGSLSFGGGYSTIDQFVGFVEVEQKNFDIANWPTFTGGGQNLQIRAESGSTRTNQRLSFTEPWLFDYPVSGGFDMYASQRDRERDVGYAYDERRVGGDVRFGKEFTEYVSGGAIYRREDIKIENFEDGVSADLRAEGGKNTVSSVGLTLERDSRDNVFNPMKGLFLGSEVDVAGGALGGDKDFYRLQGRASYDVPFKLNSVLEFRVRTGIIKAYGDSEKIPIFERFFAGGARTIRGYDERKVGPIDTSTDDPVGGESMIIGNIEYTIPVIDVVKFATFLDSGNVWSRASDLGSGGFKSGAGFGLRVKTPVGPINLDYGYPLSKQPGEEKRSGKFYFSVSRGF